MKITLVAAIAQNGVIGYQNRLPWRLQGELKLFAKITRHHPVIMGRKTYDSLPKKPLPDRHNIILSHNRKLTDSDSDIGITYCTTPDEAINEAQLWNNDQSPKSDSIMVIGGAEIYRLFLPVAQQFYYTRVHTEPKGDTYFPAINMTQDWTLKRTLACVDADQDYSAYSTELWIRK